MRLDRSLLLAAAFLVACEVNPGSSRKQDTTVAPASGTAAGAGVGSDSAGGVPAVPSDSAARTAGAVDTGVVEMYPPRVQRGGVLFALARGLAMPTPRCAWKGAPIPCYRVADGVLAIVPLPADEPAGTFSLTIDRPQGRLTRAVVVNDRDFGRELVFLDKDKYQLTREGADIARDARAIRGILAGESADRRWTGRWKEPLPGGKSAGYGVERFYYPVTDSSRAISLPNTAHARGTFGADTATAAPAKGDVPSWRHAGIDIPARRGASVVAPASGLVADIGDYTLSGRTLLVDHGQGVYSAYFHLDSVVVKKGDLVRQGRTLGRVGASGLATGPHLHYGIYVHGRDVDPAAWRDMPAWARGDSTAVAGGAGRGTPGTPAGPAKTGGR